MGPYRRRTVALVLAVLAALTGVLLVGPAGPAQALTPGWLDTDYGTSGLAVALGASDHYDGAGTVDSSGRAVVLSPVSALVKQIQISRFTVAGAKDTTFGSNGASTLPSGSFYSAITTAGDAIYVAGPPDSGNGISLVKLTPDGVVDTSYGTAGQVTVAIPTTIAQVTGIARLANGDVIVAGRHSLTSPTSYIAAVGASGALDPTWNATGSPPGVVPSSDLVASVAADGNQTVLLLVASAGTARVQRRGGNGLPDTGFAASGARSLATTFGATHLDVASDGNYYVSGVDGPGRSGPMAVTRILPSGAVDAAFGSSGTARIPLSGCAPSASSVTVTPSYVYVFGGHRSTSEFGCFSTAPIITRLTTSGTVDTTFGSGGTIQMFQVTLRGNMAPYVPFAGGVQPNGQPVLALELFTGDNTRMGAIRLHVDSVAPNGAYVPLLPRRLLDTRSGAGGPVASDGLVSLPIAGHGGVPATGAGAVVLNVTAVAPTSTGFVTVYPGGQNRPTASNLNYAPRETTPVAVTVPLGSGGAVDLYNGSRGTTHLLVDVLGYYRDGAATVPGAFAPLTPSRLLDTRNGTGTDPRRPSGGETVTFTVAGRGGVPASNVSAVVLNLLAVNPVANGHLTAYPGGTSRPATSDLNFTTSHSRANEVTVGLGAAGDVSVYIGSFGSADLVADVAGYYLGGTPTEPGTFVSVTPQRLLDTRTASPPNRGPIRPYSLWLVDAILSPVASAFVLNATVTEPTRPGFLAVVGEDSYVVGSYPTSTVNFAAGQTVANMTITSGYGFNVYNGSAGTAQAIADLEGYFLP